MKINKILGKFASEASIMASVLMSAFVLASCSDDNNNVAPKDGNPQMEVAAITAAQFGDSLTVNVTCNIKGCAEIWRGKRTECYHSH